jgi:hypothetical protein
VKGFTNTWEEGQKHEISLIQSQDTITNFQYFRRWELEYHETFSTQNLGTYNITTVTRKPAILVDWETWRRRNGIGNQRWRLSSVHRTQSQPLWDQGANFAERKGLLAPICPIREIAHLARTYAESVGGRLSNVNVPPRELMGESKMFWRNRANVYLGIIYSFRGSK